MQGDTWRALEELYDEGIIRALGVSNFDGNELKSLYETARVKPMVRAEVGGIWVISRIIYLSDNQTDSAFFFGKNETPFLLSYQQQTINRCCKISLIHTTWVSSLTRRETE